MNMIDKDKSTGRKWKQNPNSEYWENFWLVKYPGEKWRVWNKEEVQEYEDLGK